MSFPNGVRVIVQEHRASDVVALQLWVAAGARDERPSELGLAHYLEHLVFKGTPTRPFGFIDQEVEGIGGRMNAGTGQDYTYYHLIVPAARATAAIEMLADISQNASLDAGVLDREKDVVLEEMRLSEDNPRRHLGRQLYTLLFDGHPYGRPIIGSPDLVRGLTRDALAAFYRRHYVPEAFTLVVVGAVDAQEILGVADRTFGRLPRTGARRLPPPPPAPPAKRITVERPGSYAYLGLGWLAPAIDHGDTAAVDLLVFALAQARSARLPQALRDRLGLVNSVGGGYSAMEKAGALTITAQLPPENLERVETEILAEVRRLREAGVTESERRRAVTAAEARRLFARETVEGRAYAYGQAETVWRLADEQAYLDRLRAVSREQIREAARRYLDPDRYARLTFLPPQ